MQYLTAEELLAIHLEAIHEFGGTPEVLDFEKLKSCLETPQQTMFGEDLYPDLPSKAGVLFLLLIQNHPFMDGNKRTATLALLEFLERNGHKLDTTNDDLYQFAMDVATSVLDKEQVTEWIRAHLRNVS
ncbi:MAG: type II toxin-antitoxin system death-on-curing family toxin [Chloroflexi bacterium]|nr:type II toxin-antitoxin system death-on-curing family toxin [Chloroflexota bacterium]